VVSDGGPVLRKLQAVTYDPSVFCHKCVFLFASIELRADRKET